MVDDGDYSYIKCKTCPDFDSEKCEHCLWSTEHKILKERGIRR
jgi:hypothetical protein